MMTVFDKGVQIFFVLDIAPKLIKISIKIEIDVHIVVHHEYRMQLRREKQN